MSSLGQRARSARALWSAPVRTLSLLFLGAVGVAAFDPAHRHVPLCPLHAMTGWDCPFCGGLRCVDALLHGQLATALRSNLVVVAAIPFAIAYWLYWFRSDRAGRVPARLPRWVGPAVGVLLVVFSVVRNLPAMGFLRPLT